MSLPEPPLPPVTINHILWRSVTLAAMVGGAFVVSNGRGSWSGATHRRHAHVRRSTNVGLSLPTLRLYYYLIVV
jgi:hypothetical protein